MSTIISLTSFGRRLEESAYRAICTLLDQTTPARVILYLDEGDEPTSKLRSLNDLEIVCGNENVGSYSKLVWALRDFPNDVIVTVDDDIYYSRNWLSQLLEQHEKYPHKIIAHKAHSIAFRDGKIDTNVLRFDSRLCGNDGILGILQSSCVPSHYAD